MEISFPNPLTRVQQLQAQHHQCRITLLQTRRRHIPRIRTSRSEDRARLRAFEAADQGYELLDAGVVVYFEGGTGLDDGVCYVEDGDFHCEDLFLERVVYVVCWDGGGESASGSEVEEGGEVGELHDCWLVFECYCVCDSMCIVYGDWRTVVSRW